MIRKFSLLISLVFFSWHSVSAKEYHVAKKGNDRFQGSLVRPFLTIGRAAELARPGDVITVHAGVYREWVSPPQGGTSEASIVYRAAPGEKVVISGAEVVKGWHRVSGSVWRLALAKSFFGAFDPFDDLISGDWYFGNIRLGGLLQGDWYYGRRLHTGELYLNGLALHEASLDEVSKGAAVGDAYGSPAKALRGNFTWHAEVRSDSTVLVADFQGVDPNKNLTEVNVRPACFYPKTPGVNYITVRGFHMRQAATQWAAPTAEQIGAIGTHWSKGWIIENNVISESKCVGITLGKDRASGHNEWSRDMSKDGSLVYNQVVLNAVRNNWHKGAVGSHIVRNNVVYNCGAAGICGSLGAIFSTISGNDVHDIYTNRRFWGAEMAGIKLHGAIDVIVRDNKIRNTNIGIWLDWMAQGTKVINNTCSGNDYVDLFMEVNHGPYKVRKNKFLSPFSLKDWSENGTYVGNTFAGLLSFAPQDRNTPVFKPHSTVWLDTLPVRGGGNKFIRNRYLSKRGQRFKPMAGAVIPADGVDSLSGYQPIFIKRRRQ